MGIDEVKKEILDNAKAQAKAIIKEADSTKAEIMAQAESRIDSIKEQLKLVTTKTIEQYKIMMIAESSSYTKKQRLKLEKDLISDVFTNTLLEIKKSKTRTKDVQKLVKVQKDSIVYCAKEDMSALKSYKPNQLDIAGGVILEDKSGETRIDLSYETMLDEIKKEKLTEIVSILF